MSTKVSRSAVYKKRVEKRNKAFQARKEGVYFADDEAIPKVNVNNTERPTKLKASIKPGSVLIVLSGRFRGKRVVFLKQLESGYLLVTGPYKCNGCPIRRINQSFVIGTSTQVDISGVKIPDHIDDKYFARTKQPKRGEEGFFNLQKEINPEWLAKRKEDQKTVDTALLSAIEKEPLLIEYLKAPFTLTKGMAPHLLKF
ncbi:60S ribosomal protein L6 [Hondaea fermentalgiana]|uniref:60S ribosomal protein L6 n=1 Tax=Hondaea fermentalgiana TaxID=2315210 RepID=A0A2R5G1H9_9STRA|nr:60S ribosomal protein L6 [Hondaea fermentalgiana]|eukprot:GBG24860.1 60S ribosomal protein L6 [Hondaea fermentalgiana]